MSKTAEATNAHADCKNCRGWSEREQRCRANRTHGPCELYRTRMTYDEAREWGKRRNALERRAKAAGIDAQHISILSDYYDGQPLESLSLWDHRAQEWVRITEDDGPDRGLTFAGLMIDRMIADGNIEPPRRGPDPREKWA